jgi:hypothetical protein
MSTESDQEKKAQEIAKLKSTVSSIEKQIKQLQSEEQSLLNGLANLPPNQAPHRQVAVMDKITRRQNLEIGLFGTLIEANARLRGITGHQQPELDAQISQLYLMREKLIEEQKRIAALKNVNINNLRLTENNYYNNDLYLAYQDMFKMVIIMAAILLLISFMRQSGIISGNIVNILAGVTIIIFVGLALYKGYDIWRRDNMVFPEIDFGKPDDKYGKGGDGSEVGTNINLIKMLREEERKLKMLANGDCIGSDCCEPDGIHFSTNKKICEPGKKEKKDSSKESFISGSSGGCGGFEIVNAPNNDSLSGIIDSNFYSIS